MFSPDKKRIALISCHGDPAAEIGKEEAGGQNVYVRQVGEALAQQGWQVDMFTRCSDAEQPKIVQHSENCRTIRLIAGPQKFVPRDEIAGFVPEFVQSLVRFQRQNGIQYSIVHTNYWISAWIGMELKKLQPLVQVHTYHSLGAVKYQSMSTIPLIASTRLEVEKVVLKTAERVVATSPQEKAHMRSLVSHQGNIDIIPCGTDINHFGSVSQAEGREVLGIAPDEKVILYVGRFDPRKGIETLVQGVGLSKLRGDDKLRLIIGGGSRPDQSDGRERQRIESIVAELGLADITHFPGRLSPEVLPNYYAAADVTVVPSHYEPFGLVAIEAMACGTPVIASDVGGLQFTVVPEKTGLLAPAQNQAAFAEALDRMMLNPDWRTEMGENAKQWVQEKFSWAGVATQLSQLYLQLSEQKRLAQLSEQKQARKLAQVSA